MQPVNLLHLTLSMGAGGIENLILAIARHLDKQRFNMSVGCLDYGGILLEEVSSLGCDTFVLSRQDGIDCRLIIELAKILRQKEIHIINTHNQAAHFYGCLAGVLARTPVIINTEHSRHYIDGHWRRRLEKKIISFFTDKIVTVSQELKQRAVERDKISTRKLEVILNGIDLTPYCSDSFVKYSSIQEHLRDEFGIRPEEKIIGIVGRLHPVKNHELLFNSFKHIRVTLKIPASLLVVGDGQLRKNLESLSKQLGVDEYVHFAGYRQDVPQILSILDVLVLCSHTEGLPLTLLEAMAAGVPVVVTAGANKSGIVKHRLNGLVAEPKIENLAQSIIEVICSSKPLQLIDRAKCLAFNEYSISTTIDKYQDMYSMFLNDI